MKRASSIWTLDPTSKKRYKSVICFQTFKIGIDVGFVENLTHFWPIFPFYTLLKHQNKDFRGFSGGIKGDFWREMD